MNKEEIERGYLKKAKEYINYEIKTNQLINGYTDIYRFQSEVELLLKYIQHLEQKESILNKVTDKLKEDANKKIPLAEDMDWVRGRKEHAKEILNIIEGEKK